MSVVGDARLHNKWWHADALVDEINTRCQLIDDLKIHKKELQRVVSNEYHNKSTAGNDFVMNRKEFKLYRHDFFKKEEGKTKRYDFFHVTASQLVPVFPTASNSASWMAQNASQALPPRTRQHVDFSSLAQSASVAPTTKRRRESSPVPTSGGRSEDHISALPSDMHMYSYWNSGDARKLFAPRLIHGTSCDVRQVVLDRMVNQKSSSWRDVVDGGDQDNLCSEHEIFVIRQRSFYLA
jgi:hypothetical protein